MDRFALREDIRVRVEDCDDTGVLPEVYGHELQAGHVHPVLAYSGTLGVSYTDVFEDFAAAVEQDHALVAACSVNARFRVRIGREVFHRDTVGVVVKVTIVTPDPYARCGPKVSNRSATGRGQSLHPGRTVWIMPRLSVSRPKQIEAIVVYPKMVVPILHENLVAALCPPRKLTNAIESPFSISYGRSLSSLGIFGIHTERRTEPVRPSRI